jgi:hypothetical protein
VVEERPLLLASRSASWACALFLSENCDLFVCEAILRPSYGWTFPHSCIVLVNSAPSSFQFL